MSVSRLNFLHVDVQLFQHHLLKRLSLLHCIAFALLSKINWLYLWESTSEFYILFHWSAWLFFHQILHCLDYCSCIITLEVRQCQSPNFVLLNIVLSILSLWPMYLNFRISLFISTKQLAGILIGIGLNQQIKLRRTDIFTILRFPIHEHKLSLHLFNSLISFISSIVFVIQTLYTLCQSFEGGNVNGTVFNFNFKFQCSLLIQKKVLDFCMLTLCPTTL